MPRAKIKTKRARAATQRVEITHQGEQPEKSLRKRLGKTIGRLGSGEGRRGQ